MKFRPNKKRHIEGWMNVVRICWAFALYPIRRGGRIPPREYCSVNHPSSFHFLPFHQPSILIFWGTNCRHWGNKNRYCVKEEVAISASGSGHNPCWITVGHWFKMFSFCFGGCQWYCFLSIIHELKFFVDRSLIKCKDGFLFIPVESECYSCRGWISRNNLHFQWFLSPPYGHGGSMTYQYILVPFGTQI